MRERDIERTLTKAVRTMGGICFKFVSPGNAGVPDRIVLLPPPTGQSANPNALPGQQKVPRIIFVELKAEGGVLSPRQKVQIDRIRSLGFDVRVLTGAEQVRYFIDEMRGKKGGDAL